MYYTYSSGYGFITLIKCFSKYLFNALSLCLQYHCKKKNILGKDLIYALNSEHGYECVTDQ